MTNNTNSENDDNSWIKTNFNKSGQNKSKNSSKLGKRGHSMAKRNVQKLRNSDLVVTNVAGKGSN